MEGCPLFISLSYLEVHRTTKVENLWFRRTYHALETTGCNWTISSSLSHFICIQKKLLSTILTHSASCLTDCSRKLYRAACIQKSEMVSQLTHTQSWGLLFWQAYGCSAGSLQTISAQPHNSSPPILEVKAQRVQPSHTSVLSYINQTKE